MTSKDRTVPIKPAGQHGNPDRDFPGREWRASREALEHGHPADLPPGKFYVPEPFKSFLLYFVLAVASMSLGWAWNTSSQQAANEAREAQFRSDMQQQLSEIHAELREVLQNQQRDNSPASN